MGTYPPHTRPNYISRRLQRLQRVLRSAISPPGFDYMAPNTTASVYWTGEASNDWDDARNWASSSGGSGGYGIPAATNAVVFDGTSGSNNKCYLHRATQCAAFSVTEADASVALEFNQNGYALTCTTFTYNCATNVSDGMFDATITASGATFTVTAAEDALVFSAANIVLSGNCTMASAVALPSTVAQGNFTTTAALTLARLQLTAGKTATFKESANFTLTAYTTGDWDGTASDDVVLVSATPSTAWNFVNPASMDVTYIDVTDSNASNAIDATDECEDGTGNTNWTFV